MRCLKVFLGLGALGLAPSVAEAQVPQILFRDGDPIIGVGGMDKVDYVEVLDSGTWLAFIEADISDNNTDRCLMRNGFLTLREGMNIPVPTGAVLDDWGSVDMAENGNLGMVIKLRIGTAPSDGLYWNLRLLARGGDILNVPPLSPTTTLASVLVVRITADGTILALMKVRNPAVNPNRDVDALFRYRVDAQGNLLQRELLATKDATNDTLGVPVDTLGTVTTPEHSMEMNRRGDFILPVSGLGRRAMMKNLDTILAEELLESPVPGRTWNGNAFSLSKVAINDRGDTVFTGTLTPIGPATEPTNFLIVKNGLKFAQSGDVIPALSTATLAKSTPKLAISNRGDVFWRAQPTAGTAGGSAFMINHTPLMQEAVTVVEGNLVMTVPGGDDCFAISPEGRFFLGRVTLQSVGDAVLYIDFGLVTELPGCAGNPGRLQHLSGASRIGQQLRIGMDDGPHPGALPVLFFSRSSGLNAAGCGAATTLGELMLAPPFSDFFLLPAWDGVNPSVFTVTVPNNMALVDATFYMQGLFGNASQPNSFKLTNGLKYEIGPP